MAISSPYWLVAGQRSGLAVVASPRAVVGGARDIDVPGSYLVLNYWGPNTPFIFLVATVSLIVVPYQQVPSPMFVPKRSQLGVVGSRAMITLSLLLKTPPLIGPTNSPLVNYIPRDRYVTSGCRISRPLVHTFLTLIFYAIIIGSLGPSSLHSVVPRNPFYKYVISCITHRIRRPFVPLSLSSRILIKPDVQLNGNSSLIFKGGESPRSPNLYKGDPTEGLPGPDFLLFNHRTFGNYTYFKK